MVLTLLEVFRCSFFVSASHFWVAILCEATTLTPMPAVELRDLFTYGFSHSSE